MTQRRTRLTTILAAALLTLGLTSMVSAQPGYDPRGRNRDDEYRRNRDNEYRRNRDNDRDTDDYYGRNNRAGLRESIRRLNDLSRQLQRDLDRELDRSRENGSRHEDRLNDYAKDFRRACSDLNDRFDDGRDLNRSAYQAQRVLQLGDQLGQNIRHHLDNGRIAGEWSQIRRELSVISNAYRGGYSDDDSGRRDDNNRRNNRRRVGDIFRRWPF